MAPVEEEYTPNGLSRAARFTLRLTVRYRVDGDDEWRRGMTANLSRSGVLIHSSGVGTLSPEQRTDPDCPIEVVIEVANDPVPCQVRCLGTVARVVEPAPGETIGAVAVTIGDYINLAN